MTKTISVRLDDEAQRALEALRSNQTGQSEAIRNALIETASRGRARMLRAEAARLAADPDYQREVKEIQALYDELDADSW